VSPAAVLAVGIVSGAALFFVRSMLLHRPRDTARPDSQVTWHVRCRCVLLPISDEDRATSAWRARRAAVCDALNEVGDTVAREFTPLKPLPGTSYVPPYLAYPPL